MGTPGVRRDIGELVRWAARECPFYRSLYARCGVDLERINHHNDLRLLPIVTPQDLSAHGDDLRATAAPVYRVTCSSGTIHAPKVLYRTEADSEESTAVMCRLFGLAGLQAGDKLWIGQPFDLAHLGFLCMDACRRMGVLAIPGGLSVTDECMLAGLRRHRPSALFTSPSRALQLAALLESTQQGPWPLRRILLAGEPCRSEQAARIQAAFTTAPRLLYGSEETDGLGGSCGEGDGLHFMDDRFHLDLVVTGGDELVTPGEVGEAVITSLYSEGTPLIRYRLGDLVQFLPGPCSCGAPWPRIQIMGRADQTFFLYDGIKLHGYQVRSALARSASHATSYQAVLRCDEEGVEEIEVILPASAEGGEEMVKRIEEDLWMCSLDLGAAKDIGRLRFRVSLNGRFLMTRRGKTPEFVDLRKEGPALMEEVRL